MLKSAVCWVGVLIRKLSGTQKEKEEYRTWQAKRKRSLIMPASQLMSSTMMLKLTDSWMPRAGQDLEYISTCARKHLGVRDISTDGAMTMVHQPPGRWAAAWVPVLSGR